MKMRNLISALMTITMMCVSFPANAALTTAEEAMEGYGNYPESVAIDSLSNEQGLGTATNYDSFKFSLKTSDTGNVRNRFTVLDRDEEGNYLVIAAIDFNPMPSWVYYSMNDDVNSSTEVSANVHYDPTVRGTLAHFLATDESGFFKSRSNSNEYRLPTEIKPHILKNRTWTIEPEALDLPTAEQLATLSAEDRATYDTWLANRDTAQRTITADIVLPSYTELKYYANKIGRFVFPDNTVALSRSLYSSCIISNGTATYKNRVYALRFNSNGTRTLERGRELRYKDNNYRYLPMFWLDKDFFKSVAVRIDDDRTGTEVIKQVKQYKASEVSSIYTFSEIQSLYTVSELTLDYSYDELVAMGYDLEGAGYPSSTFSGYWNYPESVAIDSLSNSQGLGTATAYDSFKFSIKTSDTGNNLKNRFTVLDRDAEGNYLVIAAIDFNGYIRFSDATSNLNTAAEVSADVHYDPTNANSIANFLTKETGGFKSRTGNDYKLPTEIKEHILPNRTWTIEPEALDLPTAEQLATLSAEDRATYDTWLANRDTAQRTITADIVLPSYTELKHYADKIGRFVFTDGHVAMSRSLYSSCTISNGTATYRNRVYTLSFNNSNVRTIARGTELGYSASSCKYLPMFWLDKDFFKDVAVRIDDDRTGTEVLKQVAQYNEVELRATGYTYDELVTILGLPSISNISIIDSNGDDLASISGVTTIGAKATITGGEYDDTRLFIIAVYDENEDLVKCLIEEIEISADAEAYEVEKYLTLSQPAGASYKCKAMIWKDVETILPVKYSEL